MILLPLAMTVAVDVDNDDNVPHCQQDSSHFHLLDRRHFCWHHRFVLRIKQILLFDKINYVKILWQIVMI